MANPEHLAVIAQGLEAWNRWREQDRDVRPDLSNVPFALSLGGWNLTSAILTGANLGWANLWGADLRKADFSNANLSGANLSEANLTEANLSGVILSDVYFVEADLTGANLSGARGSVAHFWKANLTRADLSWAILNGANLTGANLSGANLTETQLSMAHLIGANFTGANLRGANLSRGNLTEATLTGANLSEAYLSRANLTEATLTGANLSEAYLSRANLSKADLSLANLTGANLSHANVSHANLSLANLTGANLSHANVSHANLSGADLNSVVAVKTDFTGSNLTDCHVYGISTWDVNMEGAIQSNLIVTEGEPHIRLDDLELAQFIYLLLNRKKLSNVINTLGERAVLILGRFTERKELLEKIALMLRERGYLPIIFDFERPTARDVVETVKILAGLSLFVIADITNPRSVPAELQATVPDYMVPFLTIQQRGQPGFSVFEDLPRKYNWALPLLEYDTAESLAAAFDQKVIATAVEKVQEIRRQKALPPMRRSAEDY